VCLAVVIAVSREEIQPDVAFGRGSTEDGGDRHDLAEDQLEKRAFAVLLCLGAPDGLGCRAIGAVGRQGEQPAGGGGAGDPLAVKGASGKRERLEHQNLVGALQHILSAAREMPPGSAVRVARLRGSRQHHSRTLAFVSYL
jgi:hypothetical protein